MNMNRLEKDRARIDEIDTQIAALFEERFTVVQDVIDYKIENRLPILDSGREAEIVAKNVKRIENEDIREYFRQLYEEMLRLSKEYQKEILDAR